jgi:D-alanine-D-alanine ligase
VSLKVAVLLGGTSAERDVSLITGQEVAKAIRKNGHQVMAVDCAFGDALIEDWERDINEVIRVEHSGIEKRKQELDRNILQTIDFLLRKKVQVVFIALHGGYGENGQIQALLDLVKIPYTGSASLASAMGIDKHISKILFEKAGVATAPWIKISQGEVSSYQEIVKLGFPLVIKPNDQGSTVGLTVVKEPDQLDTAIKKGFQFSQTVLVEKYIAGREMTVAILDQDPLPVIEIIPEHGIYDYECKYQKGKSQYIVPAKIPTSVTQTLQSLAHTAYQALGCRHYARVDFRLSEDIQPFCLEVNTLPGLTATSLVPKAAKAVGIDFNQLVERIIQLAVRKES